METPVRWVSRATSFVILFYLASPGISQGFFWARDRNSSHSEYSDISAPDIGIFRERVFFKWPKPHSLNLSIGKNMSVSKMTSSLCDLNCPPENMNVAGRNIHLRPRPWFQGLIISLSIPGSSLSSLVWPDSVLWDSVTRLKGGFLCS